MNTLVATVTVVHVICVQQESGDVLLAACYSWGCALIFNLQCACAVMVTVLGHVCLSVCLLSHVSPLERLFILKILSRTQWATEVKKFVKFSLKPLSYRDLAMLHWKSYIRSAIFLRKAHMRIIVNTMWSCHWSYPSKICGMNSCRRGFCTLVHSLEIVTGKGNQCCLSVLGVLEELVSTFRYIVWACAQASSSKAFVCFLSCRNVLYRDGKTCIFLWKYLQNSLCIPLCNMACNLQNSTP